jgi:3-deoxy-manno-octulosonate cytidylyltransferase (CMP-KDO synthetase)
MKIVAIIPARYGSKRFQGKPLAQIAGRSMIEHVCRRVEQAEVIDQVVVATDDKRIAEAVEGFGVHAVMTSILKRSGTDRVAKAAQIMELDLDDIIINVQGDQPLFNPLCLDDLIRPLRHDRNVPMSTLAFRIVDPAEVTNPKDVKVVFDAANFALYFSRSPIPCSRDGNISFHTYKHLGFYAYTRRFLEIFSGLPEGNLEKIEKLEQLRAIEYGHRIKVVITEFDSPEVDLPEDIARIETTLQAEN